MILTAPKPWREILEMVAEDRRIFILGCNGCADAAHTGGLPQVVEMKQRLEERGKEVTGYAVIDFLCQKALVKSRLRPKAAEVMAADSLLLMACGVGVQAVARCVDKVCRPACNTVPLGHTRGKWQGAERCLECGECVLDYTGGLCPLTVCAKGLLNGPCGGAAQGVCETEPDRKCGWEDIYARLKRMGKLNLLRRFVPPKDYGKMLAPARLSTTALWAIEQEVPGHHYSPVSQSEEGSG